MSESRLWRPDVEVAQRHDELVVRVDLPGITKDDVTVSVTDDAITIEGKRLDGSFYRMMPLPQGAVADQVKATFDDGVLEITMPAPPDKSARGRRLEIQTRQS